MAKLLYLQNYSNYYNRIIKRIEDYAELESYTKVVMDKINFNPNDNVDTDLIVNWSDTWTPDYMMELGENNEILGRWYVLETIRTRKGQYRFILRRDLVAEHYNDLQNSIANIDRCIVDPTNPLIYNKEPFSYNQIKKDEIPVYDRTLCPWIVGYMDDEAAHDYTGENKIVLDETYDVDLGTVRYEDWIYYDLIDTDIKSNFKVSQTDVIISFANDFWTGGYSGCHAYQSPNSSWSSATTGNIGTSNETIRYSESTYNNVKNSSTRHTWINQTTINTYLEPNITETNRITNSDITNLNALNGKKVKFQNGIYIIYFNGNGTGSHTKDRVDDSVTDYVVNCFQSHYDGSVKNNGRCSYTYTWDRFTLGVTNVTQTARASIEFKFTTSSNKLIDAPYRMFAIPLPNVTETSPSLTITYVNTNRCPVMRDIMLTLVQNLIIDLDTHLYDIQILPYCPVEWNSYSYGIPDNRSYIDFPADKWVEDRDYNWIYTWEGQTKFWRGIMVFPKESSFKFTVDKTIDKSDIYINNLKTYNELFPLEDIKIQNETEFVRLCSPNYASVFEFSPAKNKGIKAFNIACTYKPFNPFIVVAPQFDGLYGADYNDNRGLVLAGDFSLSQVSDSWIQFQIQNKSYAESFSREITSMEREQKIQREEAGWQIAAGTVTGAASGAVAGGMVGGGYGAAAGAVVGGVTSLVGGILDYQNLDKRLNEQINYRKDMFMYQLQNIKAKPDTLQKTSSVNANSKYVPFIELYDCTDQEKELLRQYITYNGMTAGFCGPIDTSGYVRANIIRFNGDIGTHELNELNNELMKGVYL